MLTDSKYRAFTILILVLILFTLFVWHGSLEPDPEKGDYPRAEHLIKDYDRYVGDRAEIGGEVIDEDPIRIEIEHGDEKKILKITGTDKQVNRGNRLSVYGTVKEDNTIEAANTVVTPFFNYIYMYVISLVGASWISLRIVKQWRWNGERSCLERREEPLQLKRVLTGGDGDG